MEAMKPPDNVAFCRGVHCDETRHPLCLSLAACQYKSSAEESRVTFTPIAQKFIRQVKDFAGEIDGKGIKTVMFEGKSPLQLITPEILEGLAEVLLHGAKKYAPNNWMRGMSWETVMGGILRHLTAFRRGEEIDPESGLPHLHHATCGLMFLSWYAHGPHRAEHEKFDDRGYKE